MSYALRSSSALLLLALASSPAWSQSAARGKLLFEDTGATSGNPSIGSCTNCHTVQDRRTAVSGSQAVSPVVDADIAYGKIVNGIQTKPAMTQFNVLDADDVADLAAFLADTPQVNAEVLTFTSPAVNTPAAKQLVTLKSPTAPLAQLAITKIEIGGTGMGNFQRDYACDGKLFAAGESCAFNVWYDPRDKNLTTPVLTLTLRDGPTGTPYTRRVTLKGSVTDGTPTTPTPPTTPGTAAPAEDSGGGAMGWGVLAALAAATAALRRRRAA